MKYIELYLENKFKELYLESFQDFSNNLNEFYLDYETISEEDKQFYVVKNQKIKIDGKETNNKINGMCYTKSGKYIGKEDFVKHLINKYDIDEFDASDPNHDVISIAFSSKQNKWYGWSHRCLCGFGIGDKLFDQNYGNEKTLFSQHGKETIKTLDQAKEAAKRFADYVS